MVINLYNTPSLRNMVDKTLSAPESYTNAKFLMPYNERNPVIRLKGRVNFDDINYVGIKENDDTDEKFYFLTNVTIKSPSIAILDCELDLYYTYRTFIKSLTAYVTRTNLGENSSTHVAFGDLADTIPMRPQKRVYNYNFLDGSDYYSSQNVAAGFIIPGEYSYVTQENDGIYVLTTINTGLNYPSD